MRLFHRAKDAEAILRSGFRDSPRYLVDRAASGVWLSYRPLDVGEGADAREYSGVGLSDVPLASSDETRSDDLVVEIPGFFVPAAVLNRFPVRLPAHEELSVRVHDGVDPAEMTDAHERLKRQSPTGRRPAVRLIGHRV